MLIDEIIDYLSGEKDFLKSDNIINIIKKSIILKADNVAKYYYCENDKEEWDLAEDFPKCTPPWENFIIQWKQPKYTYSKEMGKKECPADCEAFVLCRGENIDNQDVHKTLNMMIFLKIQNQIFLLGEALHFLDKNGQHSIRAHSIKKDKDGTSKWPMMVNLASKLPLEATKELLQNLRYPALMAINFCHCKNIKLNQNSFEEWIIKNRIKHNKIPVDKFYTLEISPFKSTVSGDNGELTGEYRHHICRGHFKNFTAERPLLGRHVGMYWWEQQFRGNKEKGEVIKDYEEIL